MFHTYRTIADVMASPLVQASKQPAVSEQSDHVLKSTRLEDNIYTDLRAGDQEMDALEESASKKLNTFPALSRDVYQSFYSLSPRHREEADLSTMARKFNCHILDHVMGGEEYPTIKNICEGRDLPAYEAAGEFVSQVSGELDTLLSEIGGDKGALSTLEKLETSQAKAQAELSDLLERLQTMSAPNETLEQAVLAAANQADSKGRQVAAVSKLVDMNLARNRETIGEIVTQASHAAKKKAEEVQHIVGAWGDAAGDFSRSAVNTELLERVRRSKELLDISKYLGRFREVFAQCKKNSYAYGRGEKYSLELGGDLSRAITSELALLASPEALPLFLRKLQRKQIKQYQRREPIYKGMGDVIVCLDESDSTEGAPAAWGKAVAMTLLEIAAEGGRRFALVHFSGRDSFKVDLFLPGTYTAEHKLTAAETFLGGGTNFVTPLRESLRLMNEQGFENADIVFVTDGECALGQEAIDVLRRQQEELRFTITGVLLDADSPGMDFSLKTFCQKIYRTSALTGDAIVSELVTARV